MDHRPTQTGRDPEALRSPARPASDALGEAVSVFTRARPQLLKVADRILGDAEEAEDVLQETWVRWQGTDRTVVLNPSALLRTTTVRLAVNVLQSARRRRESSAGPWLPEPADDRTTPEAMAERQDTVERAVYLLLETLTPRQRAAYILREGFGYPYARIAELLGISVVNARQQVSRAQDRLDADRRKRPVDSVEHRRLVQAFLGAARFGDLARLEDVLTDGGQPSSSVAPGAHPTAPCTP
ncbi:sigma-70 family RNA polymerase sigma factor [Streptomyces sp. NPDC006617]|uniref:sigma-70 family RNA polymerase sigma factor n=1 Tax=Streptomyces sp. NPDC006617 TaxID=3155354 RepID=UPI0033A8E7C1